MLSDAGLGAPHALLVDGNEVEGVEEAVSDAPFDGAVIARYSLAGPDQARLALATAERALAAPVPAHQRATILEAVAAAIRTDAGRLADLIMRQVGKPITLAHAEVERAASTFDLSAGVARQRGGRVVPMDAVAAGVGKLAFTRTVPAGAVVAITPFNFPLNLVAHKLGPAFAAGCPVVLKPAPQAPLVAFALADLMLGAGLPPAYLSVVPGSPATLGDVLLTDPRTAAVSFTGSSRVGWQIAARATRKRVLLELGNSAPAIVAADADIEGAATSLAPNAFGYAGQSCVSVQRIYVEQSVGDRFTEAFLAATGAIRSGDPADPSVTVGPVIDATAGARLDAWIAEARQDSAQLLAGATRDAHGVLQPTVLSDPPHEAKVIQEEVFGPVVSIQAVADVDAGIARANGTRYGLQAAIFTSDVGRALGAAEALRFGGVLINEAPTFRADHMPYGGIKDSGNTTEGPAYTAAALSDERLVVVQGGVSTR